MASGSAVGSGLSALGQYDAGQQAVAVGKYNYNVDNAAAGQAIQSSDAQAQIVAQQTAEKMGAAGAAYGAAGVDMSGSPLAVMSGLAAKGELNRQLTLYQGQVKAVQLRNQGALALEQGKAQNQAADLQAGTTMLTGIGNAATAAMA
jgi:hypothetical protein